jgi:hypothetical protein
MSAHNPSQQFERVKRPGEVARFLRRFDTADRAEVTNNLLLLGLSNYRLMTDGTATLDGLRDAAARIKRGPAMNVSDQRRNDDLNHTPQREARAARPVPSKFFCSLERSGSREGAGKRSYSANATLRDFIADKRADKRQAVRTARAAQRESRTEGMEEEPIDMVPVTIVEDSKRRSRGAPAAVLEESATEEQPASDDEQPAVFTVHSSGLKSPDRRKSSGTTADLSFAVSGFTASISQSGFCSPKVGGSPTQQPSPNSLDRTRHPSLSSPKHVQAAAPSSALDAVFASAAVNAQPPTGKIDGPAVDVLTVKLVTAVRSIVVTTDGARLPMKALKDRLKSEASEQALQSPKLAELYKSLLLDYHISVLMPTN